eukprot:RCo004168
MLAQPSELKVTNTNIFMTSGKPYDCPPALSPGSAFPAPAQVCAPSTIGNAPSQAPYAVSTAASPATNSVTYQEVYILHRPKPGAAPVRPPVIARKFTPSLAAPPARR